MQDEAGETPIPCGNIDAVICNGLFLRHNIDEFTSLKFIQLTGAGYDRVPIDKINARNIKLFNARGVYSVPMAEFALCGVLSLYKKMTNFSENRKNHIWQKQRDLLELYGKRVCIVGCGSVGTECAKRFSAMGCRAVGIDAAPYQNDNFEGMFNLSELEKTLSVSDICILALPLSEETYHLFDEKCFEAMKKQAILVNISRGAVVKTDALVEALKTKLYGAVLDVFEEEPLPASSPLWDMENVILTPHNSFVGEGNSERLFNVIINNFKEITGKC